VCHQVPKISVNSKSNVKDTVKGDLDIPSWRLGLRKTGSTSMVPQETTVARVTEEDKNLPRSASSPRLAEDEENKKNEKNVSFSHGQSKLKNIHWCHFLFRFVGFLEPLNVTSI